ncbi:MAG: 30S ribosomal protein S5 [Nanoarchaeota archaeon]
MAKRNREKHPVGSEGVQPEPRKVVGVDKKETTEEVIEKWIPKTEIGKRVKNNQITDINELLDKGLPILESEIVDKLIPGLEHILLNIGQSKGKFGGGKKSIWKQTQKKTKEGNKPKFSTLAVVGNKNGYIGIGQGKAKETVPAREKAVKNAKINIIKIRRGCGDWACNCGEAHSIPFKVYGRCGGVRIHLSPAPKGTGIVADEESKKILEMVGIKDAYSNAFGQTRSRLNLIKACFEALKHLLTTKVQGSYIKKGGVVEGSL